MADDDVTQAVAPGCPVARGVAANGSSTGRPRTAPRVRGLPLVGVFPEMFLCGPLQYTQHVTAKYGDLVEIPFPGTRVFYVSDPALINEMMSLRADEFVRGALFRATHPRVRETDPVFYAFDSGDERRYTATRRLLVPAFTRRGLNGVGEGFCLAISEGVDAEWADELNTGRYVDMTKGLQRLGLDVLFRAMFSRPLNATMITSLTSDLNAGMRWVAFKSPMFSLPRFIPRPYAKSGIAALRRIEAFFDELIEESRQDQEGVPTVLKTLVNSRRHDGSSVSDAEIRADMLGIVVGGHETTAGAIAWTLGLLCTNPLMMAEAVSEADALGDSPLAFDDVAKIPYINACFDEAQRIQGGAVGINLREATTDTELGGYFIPGGATVAYSTYALAHDPRYWESPDAFLPKRFLDGEAQKKAYIPFGVGARRCIGSQMAYFEGALVIAEILRRYRIEVKPGWHPRPAYRGSTALKRGLPVRLSSR